MNKNLIRNKKLVDTDFSDRRRTTALVLDVETTLGKGENQIIFDIGWTITEASNEKKVLHRSYLVKEIFLDIKMMERAYYFEKFPSYIIALAEQKTELKGWNEIIQILNQDIQDYNVKELYAYNSNFDKTAIRKTHNILNNGLVKVDYKIYCLWSLATQTFLGTEKFIKTALANGWVTEKGNIKTSAEVAYKYMTGDYDFIESHTALEDSSIETELLWKINKYGVKKDKECRKSPWKTVANIKEKKGI